MSIKHNMKHLKSLLAAAAILGAVQAQAYDVSLTNGATSAMAGVTTETFQGAAVFTRGGGGRVFNSDSAGAFLTGADIWLVSGLSAQPYKGIVATNDKWFSVGGDDAAAVFSFAATTSYVGFLWGSADTYNTVSFYDPSANLIASFTGGAGGLAAHQVGAGDGRQWRSTYFNFSAASIGAVKFESSGNAFEIDNLSATTAVPEPETYALMFTGLGAVAFVARRRRV